jgi:hypothetical protein
MRSTFGRVEGPLSLGRAPQVSPRLSATLAQPSLPANLASARPADYEPPSPAAAIPAYAPPAAAATIPANEPPPTAAGLVDAAQALSMEHPRNHQHPREHALASARLKGQVEYEEVDAEKVPPDEAGAERTTDPHDSAQEWRLEHASPWKRDVGELIGAARDRAEALRNKLTLNGRPQLEESFTNTSGMGRGRPLPEAARGLALGGLAPLGLFAFVYGNPMLGLVGLALFFLKWYPLYAIYMIIVGRRMAWRNKRFESVEAYEKAMRRWDLFGFYMLPVYLLWYIVSEIMRRP